MLRSPASQSSLGEFLLETLSRSAALSRSRPRHIHDRAVDRATPDPIQLGIRLRLQEKEATRGRCKPNASLGSVVRPHRHAGALAFR